MNEIENETLDTENDKEKKTKEKLEIEEKEKKLKEKYGVMKEIPKQKIENEEIWKAEEIESSPKEEIESMSDLVLKTEKIEGKLDVIGGYRDELNERLSQMSEEIGELRSMIMESDRSFSKVETEFEEIKEVVGDIEPLKVKKGFEKKEQEIMENRVKIEKTENLLKALEKESQNFRKIMEKIKSFDNLADISKKINEKIDSIEDTKKYADRTSAKVENIFSEVTEKVNELQNQKEKIIKLDELTTEITQMLDEISIKMKDFSRTKDFKSFQEEIKNDINKLGENKNKIEEIGKLIKETNIDDKFEKIKQVQENLNEIEKRIKDISTKFKNKQSTKNLYKINELEKSVSGSIELLDKLSKNNNQLIKQIDNQTNDIIESRKKLENIEKKKIPEITNYLNDLNEKISGFVDIESVNEIIKTIEKDYQKINQNKSKIEDVEYITKELSERVNELNKIREKIKGFDKLLETSTKLEKRVSEIDELSELPHKIKKIKQIIEKQNSVISDLIDSIERVKNIPNINIKELNDFEHSLRFYQLLNILPFLKDEVKLKEYSDEMKQIIRKMRESGSWDSKKERFMNDILKTSKKMIRPGNQDEILDKIEKITSWVSNITDEIKEKNETQKQIEQGIENLKVSLRNKVDSTDVEDVYILERELIELTGKFNKLKSLMERQNIVVDDVVERMKEIGSKKIDDDIIKKIQLSNRFYQILNTFQYIVSQEKVKNYSVELNQIIEDMKILRIWDKEKENFMEDMIEINKRHNQIEEERDERVNKIKMNLSKFIAKPDFRDFQKIMSDEINRINNSLRDKASINNIDNLLLVDKNLSGLTKKVEKLRSVVEKQNFVINNLITKIEEKEVEGIDKKSIKDLQTSVRFYQILNILPYVVEPTRIKTYLLELKDVIEELKSNKKWNDEKEMFMKNFLSSLSDNYKSRGYEEIGTAYAEII